jgi:hypothetical protein
VDPASIIGIAVGVFVVIFGGRGLVDLVRGARERRQAKDAVPAGAAMAETMAVAVPPSTTPNPDPIQILKPTFAPPPELDPVYRRVFVGRDAELHTLHAAFDEAVAGHGSLAMVVGEPGIGKTSLTEQLAGYVAEQGR